MSGIDQILADYAGLRDAQEEFYKDLHQHPELSHQEQQTPERRDMTCSLRLGLVHSVPARNEHLLPRPARDPYTQACLCVGPILTVGGDPGARRPLHRAA